MKGEIDIKYKDSGVYNRILIYASIPVLETEDSICESCTTKKKNKVINVAIKQVLEKEIEKTIDNVIKKFMQKQVKKYVSELLKEYSIKEEELTVSESSWLAALLIEKMSKTKK